MQNQSHFPNSINSQKLKKLQTSQYLKRKQSNIIANQSLKSKSKTVSMNQAKQHQINEARQRRLNLLNGRDGLVSQIKRQIAEIIQVAYQKQLGKDTFLTESKFQDNLHKQHKGQQRQQLDKKQIEPNNGNKLKSGLNNKKQQLKRFKKINTQPTSTLINRSNVIKYNLNQSKLGEIQNDKAQVFRTRPKLSTTPLLNYENPEDEQKSRAYRLEILNLKSKKNKIKFAVQQKKQQKHELKSQVELPRVHKKSKVVYTQVSKTIDILEDRKQIEVLQRYISKQPQSHYHGKSLANSNIKESRSSSTKIIRLHRINFLKP